MFRDVCRVFVLALVAGGLWSCGGDRVTQSQVAEGQVGRPLSKLAAAGHSLVVVATVHEDEGPVSGVMVEFSRSVAGQSASYDWSGMTDDEGQAQIEITGGSGYYQARAVQDGSEVGSWSSIPLNAGAEVMLSLPIGGRAQVLSSPPMAADEDDALTMAFVMKGIERYERDGREATLAYYSSQESIEGERHMTIIDPQQSIILASGLSIRVGASAPTGAPFPPMEEVPTEGLWVDHQDIHSITRQLGPMRSFLIRHDDLVFMAGHFTLQENLADATRNYIAKAIAHYDREGLEATIAYYNSRESVDGQFYLFLIGADDLYLAHPIFPHLIGTDIKDVVGSDGQELGKEIAQATEEGHWVEYLWPNPVTQREEHKAAWVVRHDGLIFASGYYTSDIEAGPPPWQGADPREYTVAYVQRAIERYERDGLEAMRAYYNSVASIEGEWYLFATDADDIYHVHPLIPSLIGTDLKDVVGSDGYELGKALAKAEEGVGVWVEYLWPHPVTLAEVPKVGYAIRRDGMIFASGYYPAPESPEAGTKAYVQAAIDKYKQEGLEATVAYYSSRESIEGQSSLFLIDENGRIAVFLVAPGAVGLNIEAIKVPSTGFELGKEIVRATEAGHWIHYQRPHVRTGVILDAHAWVIRYDGLIFGSSYFGEPAGD
ncbi:MAG: hypothetical protein F4Y79_12085 [Gemmatimonadetes bacterium]|nr:hypothetical protein [Gemmatimonadota bacterium]